MSTETDNVYVGITTLNYLSSGMAGHRANYNKWIANKGRCVSSFEIIKHKDCKIILLEKFPCDSKDQLTARQQYWIDNTPNCVNKNKASTGLSITEYHKLYTQQPKVKAYKKQYDQQPKAKTYKKQYDLLKIKCICGIICPRKNYSKHIKCQKHTKFINQHEDLSEIFQLEMQARLKTALVLNNLKKLNL